MPTGTLTFLLTDIEGSTRLWEAYPTAMEAALARHDVLLRRVIEAYGGAIFKTVGDQFCAAFTIAPDALAAALEIHHVLHAEPWDEVGALRVRAVLHTGTAEMRAGDYFGPPINRAARLLAAGHGGQTLLSQATYELVRDHLPEGVDLRDLGTHRLKDLQRPEQIFQVVVEELPADFPPLITLEFRSHNLPLQLTSFIGRESEVASIQQLLRTSRLVTLTGVGGCGKTRLALQVAADLLEQFPDGVWLVDLAPLSNQELVPQTVAAALGVREDRGRSLQDTLTDFLHPKSLLLLLDNCEHLLPSCRTLIDTLLRACAQLRILATSREVLNVPGEVFFRVPSLSVPGSPHSMPHEHLAQYEAVRLFVERAVVNQPRFVMTDSNAPVVTEMCRQLDGMPLAIELAAAWTRVLTVEEIQPRLDDRFRLLTRGNPLALPRQQTLQAAIDWSYDLLSEAERSLLRRLSVFAGGWTLEAAEAVCSGLLIADCRLMIDETGVASRRIEPSEAAPCSPISNQQSAISNPQDVLNLLAQLVDRSLVLYEEPVGRGRYRLLETIRQYGWERLQESGEVEEIQRRHRDFFLRLAEEIEPQLWGKDQAVLLDRLELEHDNFRAALDWCARSPQEMEAELRLAGALQRFWAHRDHPREGRARLAAALARHDPQRPTEAYAKALLGAGRLAVDHGEPSTARSLGEESLSVFQQLANREGTARVLAFLGSLAYTDADYTRARALIEESLEISRQIGDRRTIAHRLHYLGLITKAQGDSLAAREFYEASLGLMRESGDRNALIEVLNTLGSTARDEGDYARADALLREALATAREIGVKWGVAFSLCNLGRLTCAQGSYAEAEELYREALTIEYELASSGWGVAHALRGLGAIAYQQRDDARARALHEEALSIYRHLGDRPGLAAESISLGRVMASQQDAPAGRALIEEGLAIARELGDRGLIAQALSNLGRRSRQEGDPTAARARYSESLRLRQETNDPRGIAESLEDFASLAAAERNFERAARLWGAAEALRQAIGFPMPPRERAEQASEVAAARDGMGEAPFAAAWAEGRAWPLQQAVAYAIASSETSPP